jgi:stress response protein YsnF
MTQPSTTEDILPLAEERVTVGKVQTETGRLRIRLVPEEHESLVEGNLTAAQADVERVAVGRLLDETPQPRWEGDVYVVPVVEEVLVTEKKLRLIEEVRIRLRTTTTHVEQSVTLRRTELQIERTGPEEGPTTPTPGEAK